MDLFLLGLMAMAVCDKGSNSKKKDKKSKKRKTTRKNNSWLDAAWFHDHGQHI